MPSGRTSSSVSGAASATGSGVAAAGFAPPLPPDCHAPDDLADRDGVAGLGEDLLHHPGGGSGNLGVDLVGRDLDDRLVGLDGVAGLLGPLEDHALGDRLAHGRHGDVDRFACGLLGGRLRRGAPRRCARRPAQSR